MSRRHAFALMVLVTAVGMLGRAQSRPRSNDAFEVATIKSSGFDGPLVQGRWIRMESANRFVAHNHSVRTLLAAAYDLPANAISGGPSWVDSDRWEIIAKTPG